MHWNLNQTHFWYTCVVDNPNQLAESLGLTSLVGSQNLNSCFLGSALFYLLNNQLFNFHLNNVLLDPYYRLSFQVFDERKHHRQQNDCRTVSSLFRF